MVDDDLITAGFDPFQQSEDYYFDEEQANKAIRFCETFLKHTKGEKGKAFKLNEWQIKLTKNIFGWRHKETKLRRFRSAYVELPRKNGKSTYASFLSIYFSFFDGEQGAENYIAATDRDQAGLIYDIVSSMLRMSPALAKRFTILDSRKRIVYRPTSSFLAAIASDAASAHGFNSHFICIDETHAQKTREFYDVLKTSQGSRKQPFFLSITTAGHDRNSICYQEHEYSTRLRNNELYDPTHLPIIFGANLDDDPHSEATWYKANPSLGESINLDYLKQQSNKAKEQPSYLNTFKQLHLNIWTEAANRFFSMEDWEACHDPYFDESILKEIPCTGGLDLSDTLDLTSFALVWKLDGRYVVKTWNWLPQHTVEKRNKDVKFQQFADDELCRLTITPGKRQDQSAIERKILDLSEQYKISAIGFDRWSSSLLVKRLEEAGIVMAAFGQGFASMNQPTKEIEALVVEHRLEHLNDPLLKFATANSTVATDPSGNIKLVKPDHNSSYKIDPIVATVMAIGINNTIKKEEYFSAPSFY